MKGTIRLKKRAKLKAPIMLSSPRVFPYALRAWQDNFEQLEYRAYAQIASRKELDKLRVFKIQEGHEERDERDFGVHEP